MIENKETSPTNKYSTRKKIIDFAKLGERLSLTGSNCHFCKSVMTVQNSNACRSTEKLNNKKKSCNKKFCYDCLQKNFPIFWGTRNNKDWKCPCCSDECICMQCKKNSIKEKNLKNKNNETEINNSGKVYKSIESLAMNHQNLYKDNNDVEMEGEEYVDNNNYEYYDNMYHENSFDFNKFYKSLHYNKLHLEKLSALHKPENCLIPDVEFIKYNNARDDYVKTLEIYKENLTAMNLNKLLN